MASTVSDFLIERLYAWGVRRIFGFPGDGINGIIHAIDEFGRKHDGGDAIDFVQVRHEEQAAFMACAHAKFTGELGVCLATSGPGAIHLLNGLYDAKNDHVPVLAITGQSATTAIGSEYQQEIDLSSLYKDVASEYLTTVVSPAAARHSIDRAVRGALGARSVTALIFPKDIQEEAAVENPPHMMNYAASSIGFSPARALPHDADLRRAAEVLNAGSKVAIMVGSGAMEAADVVIAVADRLQAGCAKALLGKAVLPDDLPWVTGTLGLLGTYASSEMMSNCDTLLLIGTNFPYAQFLPQEGKARGVQIDINASRLGVRFPTEVNLQGDAFDTLEALLPLLQQKTDTSWRDEISRWMSHGERVGETRADISGVNGINPEDLFIELSRRLPPRCIVTADAGTSTNWAARHLQLKRGMKFSLSGGLATMGSAVPYAISAKFAFPDRIPIAVTGDGAMQMNGMNELITVKRYLSRWSDPSIVFIVANNRDLNQVTWEMRIESGAPDYPASQHLPDVSMAAWAKLLGFTGIRVERVEDLANGLDMALRARQPAVLEVMTDPNISMLPAHITRKQVISFGKAMLKGDPEEGPAIVQSVKGVIAGMFPQKTEETKQR